MNQAREGRETGEVGRRRRPITLPKRQLASVLNGLSWLLILLPPQEPFNVVGCIFAHEEKGLWEGKTILSIQPATSCSQTEPIGNNDDERVWNKFGTGWEQTGNTLLGCNAFVSTSSFSLSESVSISRSSLIHTKPREQRKRYSWNMPRTRSFRVPFLFHFRRGGRLLCSIIIVMMEP